MIPISHAFPAAPPDAVTVFPDHLEVTVGGVPPINVRTAKLKESEERPCRRGTWYKTPRTPYSPDLDFCLAERGWPIRSAA